jgi:HSP20 family molecular chaperone IbpA
MTDLIRANMFDLRSFDRIFDEFQWGNIKTTYPCNLYVQKDNTTVIEYALAGFSKEEIQVEIKGDVLSISAKKKENSNALSGENNYLHTGIAYRSFSTTWKLAGTVNKKAIKTSYIDGILKIVLPCMKEEIVKVEIE